MTDSLYIATTDRYSGKSLVSLGIAELLLRRTSRIGIFRPVIGARSVGERDKNIDLLLSHFNLEIDYHDTFGLLMREAVDLIGRGRYDDALDRIIEKFKVQEQCCDFVLCIGSDLEAGAEALEFDFNADVARNLGSSVLLVTSGANRDVSAVVNSVRTTLDAYQERGAQVLGIVVNRATRDDVDELRDVLAKELKQEGVVLSVIPAHQTLSSPTLREVAEQLGADILYGRHLLGTLAERYLVIAMRLENYLSHLTEGALLVTPGDRNDIILSAMQAHQSRHYPQIAGILLSGGLEPAPSVSRLLDGLPRRVPILSVQTDTYDTAANLGAVHSYITADNQAKIDLSLELFEEFIDTPAFEAQISSIQPRA